ncbi:MAG: class I SAM-dependent methyltransferase [Phycisphaerales bacterium]|nr:MAG: class I SAM-dependent methyltransferase [Phycisphaerales bacterium]
MTSSARTRAFDDLAVARGYQEWYAGPGRYADYVERALLETMLAGLGGITTVLEVGCGTGHFTRWFADIGFQVTGVELSAAMLAEARRSGSPLCIQADAQSLPFAAGAFDLVAMITSLEFVADPDQAVQEAVRVADKALLLGVLNRCSLLAVWQHGLGHKLLPAARFFAPWELEAMVRRVAAQRLRSLRWRTTLWPLPGVWHSALPWGGFIGLCAEFTTRDSAPQRAAGFSPRGLLP